jgi:Mitochondrial carrier protein
VQPIDLIKTLYQMQMNEYFIQTSFLQTGKTIYKKAGIKGLYIGWQARIIQYVIQTFFTSALLEYLENKVKII